MGGTKLEQNISKHLQDSIIHLAITDDDFAKAVIGQILPEFFVSEVAEIVYKIASDYILEFKEAPKDHIGDEILRRLAKDDKETRELVARYLTKINKLKVAKEYVLERLDQFIKSRALINALYEAGERAETGNIDAAHDIIWTALKAGIKKENKGVMFLHDYSDLDKRGDKPEYLFNFGIPLLDKQIGGFSRGELILIMGPYKGTKSYCGHHLARAGLIHGLSVLHISHENSLEEVQKRYDQMFGSLIDEKEPKEIEMREMIEGKVEKSYQMRETVYNKDLIIKNRKKILSYGGKLVIRKYPMYSCSPIELASFINYLENFEDFKPDIIINDYVEVMRPIDDKKQTRDSINETYMFLKGIADEKQIAMITMSQVNSEGLKRAKAGSSLDIEHTAEDRRKGGNIDKGFSIFQPRELEEYNEAVLQCFANRNKKRSSQVVIGQNLDIGQFYIYNYLAQKKDTY